MKISNFQNFCWEGHSLATVFIEHGWQPIIDQKDEEIEKIIAYIDIVFEFYREPYDASRDNKAYVQFSLGCISYIFSGKNC